MVARKRLELLHSYEYVVLSHVRLPITPPGHIIHLLKFLMVVFEKLIEFRLIVYQLLFHIYHNTFDITHDLTTHSPVFSYISPNNWDIYISLSTWSLSDPDSSNIITFHIQHIKYLNVFTLNWSLI